MTAVGSPRPSRDASLPAPLDRCAPVWVAPMAGGPSGPVLVIAAASAGCFAQLAGGYKSAAAMAAEVRQVRESGVDLFGVNLFVPNVHPIADDAYAEYASSLAPDAQRVHYSDPWPARREDDDDWLDKIAALLGDPVPLVSFTFGLPDPGIIAELRAAGTITAQTVTSPEEARLAEQAGVDLVVVQGFAAGGHSGIWAADRLPEDIPLPELVRRVRAAVNVPTVAAGGIASRSDVEAALVAGASAVAVGTVVLRAHESGASALHKEALASAEYAQTAFTRAFTGRPARALVNRLVRDHPEAPSGYPAIHHLTRPLRAAATAAADASALNLWAGRGWRAARPAPLADILHGLTPG
jgi:nitronate monooxygenase